MIETGRKAVKFVSQTEIDFAGVIATKLVYEDNGSFKNTIVFKRDNLTYSIEYLSTNEENSQVFDQILSTLKFVDDVQSRCQYGGKEYKIGDQFKALDGCNSCICEGTQVSCTEMGCFNN